MAGFFSRNMSGLIVGVLGFSMCVAVALAAGYGIYVWLGSAPAHLFPIWMSLLLTVITPMTVIAIRHQIRLTRIKLIDLFAKSFGLSTKPPQAHDALAARRTGGELGNTYVSFEFVKGKYYVDLDLSGDEELDLRKVPRFPMMLHADWMLLLCALPFMAFSGFGMFLLFAPVIEILTPGASISSWLWPSLLALGGAPLELINDRDKFPAAHANMLTVAALAFAGSYFYCIRLLLRAVAAFDLSPLTFLRAFAHMVLAVTLAVVIYRVFPSFEGAAGFLREAGSTLGLATAQPGATADPTEGVKSIWLIISFALGFVPDEAIQYALLRSGVKFKARYDELEDHAKTIPLTVLDGIDSFTAFRLEESNIFDVQNLATFNPIMLHIETPFGIYETIDWVAQAQLCTVVGAERFLLLKTHNIRTIFDLERVVLSEHADKTTVRLVGSLLLTDCKREAACRSAFGLTPTFAGEPALSEGQEARLRNVQGLGLQSIEHMVRVIVDDLHVHRLRQIWILIGREIGVGFARFEDDASCAGNDSQKAA